MTCLKTHNGKWYPWNLEPSPFNSKLWAWDSMCPTLVKVSNRLWFGIKEVETPGQRMRRKYPKGVEIQGTVHQDHVRLLKHWIGIRQRKAKYALLPGTQAGLGIQAHRPMQASPSWGFGRELKMEAALICEVRVDSAGNTCQIKVFDWFQCNLLFLES